MGIFDVLPRTAETRNDRLTIGGVALADVAAEFGTPAFVVDEQGLRETAREFTSRHAQTDVHFASKALPCAPVMRSLAEEGLGCDVASAGLPLRSPRSASSPSTTSAADSGSRTGPASGHRRSPTTPRRRCAPCTSTSTRRRS